MPNENGQEEDMENIDFTLAQARDALTDEELKVLTMRKGPKASIGPNEDVQFNDLRTVGWTSSDTGRVTTLGDIEKAILKKAKQALANGTIPRNTRGSSEIQ